jgi:hypothetical protein
MYRHGTATPAHLLGVVPPTGAFSEGLCIHSELPNFNFKMLPEGGQVGLKVTQPSEVICSSAKSNNFLTYQHNKCMKNPTALRN